MPATLVALAFAGTIGAEPAASTPELTWAAPSGCPSHSQLVGKIEGLVGHALAEHDLGGVEFSARGNVTLASSGGYELELQITSASVTSTRQISAPSCALLGDAAALIVAVSIDPLAVVETVDASAHQPATPEPPSADEEEPDVIEPIPPAAPSPAPIETRPIERERPRLPSHVHFGLRMSGGGSFGPLPSFGPGLSLATALLIRRWRAEVAGSYWFAREARLGDANSSAGADIRLWTVGFRGGYAPKAGPVEFPLVLGIAAGDMRAVGVGVVNRRARHSLWLAAEAGAAVAWLPTERVGLWLQVLGTVPLVRPAFEVSGGGTVHRAAAAGIAGLLGVEARFP